MAFCKMVTQAGKMATSKYGKFQDGRSKMAAPMVKKPCGRAASSPIVGTMLELCTVLDRTEFFQCHTECSDGHMPYMYLPDVNAAVSRYFVYLIEHCGIHQGVC